MSAARHDLTIEQGATWTLQITWQDETGNPVDLTGFHVRAQIRPRVLADTVLLDLDSAAPPNGVSFGPLDAQGLIDITVDAAVTAELRFRRAVYDLEAEAPDGFVTRLLEGVAQLNPEVTR